MKKLGYYVLASALSVAAMSASYNASAKKHHDATGTSSEAVAARIAVLTRGEIKDAKIYSESQKLGWNSHKVTKGGSSEQEKGPHNAAFETYWNDRMLVKAQPQNLGSLVETAEFKYHREVDSGDAEKAAVVKNASIKFKVHQNGTEVEFKPVSGKKQTAWLAHLVELPTYATLAETPWNKLIINFALPGQSAPTQHSYKLMDFKLKDGNPSKGILEDAGKTCVVCRGGIGMKASEKLALAGERFGKLLDSIFGGRNLSPVGMHIPAKQPLVPPQVPLTGQDAMAQGRYVDATLYVVSSFEGGQVGHQLKFVKSANGKVTVSWSNDPKKPFEPIGELDSWGSVNELDKIMTGLLKEEDVKRGGYHQ